MQPIRRYIPMELPRGVANRRPPMYQVPGARRFPIRVPTKILPISMRRPVQPATQLRTPTAPPVYGQPAPMVSPTVFTSVVPQQYATGGLSLTPQSGPASSTDLLQDPGLMPATDGTVATADTPGCPGCAARKQAIADFITTNPVLVLAGLAVLFLVLREA